MVGDPLDVFGRPVPVEPLERFGDARMQRTALWLKQVAVGHVVGQRVSEAVFVIGKQTRLVEELAGLQLGEATPEIRLGRPDDLPKDAEGDVVTDDRRRLEPLLLMGRQPVDARGEEGVHARRDLDGVDGAGRAIRPRLADEELRLGQTPHALLEEERVALRARDQEPFEVTELRIGPHERLEKFLGTLARQGVDTQLRVVGLTSPGLPVLGAVIHDQQQPRRSQAVDQPVEHGLCLCIDPVKILDDQEQRLLARFP